MKQAHNNEADLLLRSLARKGKYLDASGGGGEDLFSSVHLDADELNSYAEGLAPAPARARYTKHLADCAACRGVVVDLTEAAGVANRLGVSDEKRGAGFWQKLSALFSPTVLRYAVPAVVLTAVIGIGFLMLRPQRENDLVARNQSAATPLPANQLEPGEALKPTPEPRATLENGTPAEVSRGFAEEKPVVNDEKAPALEPPTLASKGATEAAKDSGQPAASVSAAESQPYAPEPKVAAAPPPARWDGGEKSADLAKERQAKREDQARDQDQALRTESDDLHGPNRSRNNAGPAATQRSAGIVTGRGPSTTDKKKDKAGEVEARTVMGRRFKREGGAWVDTAYDSSRAIRRIARGSDPFRALVADEPGLRTISEQLDGVVIVVWKGRAYRIQ